MKRTHKKIFGLFGLVMVAIVTIFAAFLPSPGTLAADSTHVTDNISVEVVRNNPTIDIRGIQNDSVSPDGRHTATISYREVESITVKFTYTDPDGNVHVTTLPTKMIENVEGEIILSFNTLTGECNFDGVPGQIAEGNYGYGDYLISVEGVGEAGEPVGPKTVSFSTEPIGDGSRIVKEEGAGEDGDDKYYLEVDYDNGEGEEIPGSAEIDHLVVKIYDEDGNEVKISPLIIYAPDKRIEVPFAEIGDGTYRFDITAFDKDGNVIGKDPAYSFYYTYVGNHNEPIPVPNTADTGGMMGNLNISKTDYIITGLIVFGIVGISAAVFISKHDKKTGLKK